MRRYFAHHCRSLIKHPVYAKFFCPDCHNPDMDQFQRSVNYFLLYLVPQSFSVDKQLISRRYRDFQRLLHPDILQARNIHCQDYSKCVSLAYVTLSQDVLRANYLVMTRQLKLNGRALSPEDTMQDERFMEEMFDLRCELQASKDRKEELEKVMKRSEAEKQAYVEAVEQAFEHHDYDKAADLTIRLQFLHKVCEDAKELDRVSN